MPRTHVQKIKKQRRRHARRRTPVRSLGWIASVNKVALAAISAGLAGIITGVGMAVPRLLTTNQGISLPLTPPPLSASPSVGQGPPLAIVPTSDPGPSREFCDQGPHIAPGAGHNEDILSSKDLHAWLQEAADPDETTDSLTLEARKNQTIVITAVHVVLLRRFATQPTTVVHVLCPGAPPGAPPGVGGPPEASISIYRASVNLDAANPKLRLTKSEHGKRGVKQISVDHFEDTVTHDRPMIIDLMASTKKFNTTWKFHVDYAVDGKSKSVWMPDARRVYHTAARRRDDPVLTYTLRPDGVFTARNGPP